EYASQLQSMFNSGPKKQKAPTTPFIGDITILYAFDFPERMAVVDEEDMRAVGASDVESLHRLALLNMEARTGELAYKEIQPESGIYALTYEDSLAPSRVLLQDKWAAVARKIKGNPILAIPSREFVLFVAEGDAARVRSLRELVRKVFSGEDHAVSMQLMHWTPRGWELYSDEQ
ncbi:MAG TPA: hypothetical protein PK881_18115, partial [Leptospiraceae bacterium]|nr:hypothetical protein [Leptospiraceae bacterium]